MRDKIHYPVIRALEKENWAILADPWRLKLKKKKYVEIDLEAEKIFAAEKGSERILVEIKTISSASILYQFYAAYGQYEFYRDQLEEKNIDQRLYLAISKEIYEETQEIEELAAWLKKHKVNLLVVDLSTETISQWITY